MKTTELSSHKGPLSWMAANPVAANILMLFFLLGGMYWATQIKQLKVGLSRRFSSVTKKTLVADLRSVLTPRYVTRAREIASQMSKPAESVANAADLLEETARLGRFGGST